MLMLPAKCDYEVYYPDQCGQQAKDQPSKNEQLKSAEACCKPREVKFR